MAEEITGELEIEEMELDEENLARLISNDEESEQQNMQDDGHEGQAGDSQEDMMQDCEHCEHDDEEKVIITETAFAFLTQQNTVSDIVGPRLFIGGLNSGTTDDDFREHFEKYGKMTECSIPRKGTEEGKIGKSRGFGFVTMTTMAETEAVLKDTHVIKDKVVTVAISRPPDAPERKLRLSVRNLDVEKTTEETLAAHFGRFGIVANCNISKKQVDGKVVSRGIGYVTMTTEEEVQAVLNGCINGHQTVDEKTVDVKRVSRGTQTQDRLRKLWFGGLDKDKTTESDVADYFSAFGAVTDCVIVRDPPETEGGECKSKGYGFINMASVGETVAILKHTGPHKIHGKELIFNRVPLPPSQNDYDRQPVKEIYVSGLKDGTLTMDDLRAYFNTHANVRNITMIKDEGAARILLGSADDAVKLAHMQDHCVKKYWLIVRMADPQSAVKPDKSKKPAAKQKQSVNKKGSGNQSSSVKSSGSASSAGQQSKNSRRRRTSQGSSRQSQGPRQARGFGSSGGRQYRNQPMPGGYVPSRQAGIADYFYEKDPSGYGPVRGRGLSLSVPRGHAQGRGGGSASGWVFVDNLYQEPEVHPRPFSLKGFVGKGRGSVLNMGVGYGNGERPDGRFSDADGLGGGYDDMWGEGGNMTRGKGRGRGRGWRPYFANQMKSARQTNYIGNMESDNAAMDVDGEEQEFREDAVEEGNVESEKESDQDEGEDDMESEDEAEDGDKAESDQEIEDPRKLFIGGLHAKTTEENMKEHFSAYGTVESCTIARDRSMFNKKGKHNGSKGFGFITMSSAEEAQAVLREKHTLQGRQVAVTISKPLSAPERKLRLSVSHLDKVKTTDDSLRDYFSKFGTVTSCRVSKEEVDGKMVSRGFGFVTMALQEEVDTIISENSHGRQIIDGAKAEVKQVHVDRNKNKRRQIYIGNLDPEKTTKDDIRAYFSQWGNIQDLTMPRKGRDAIAVKKTYAFVRMCNQEDFEKIIKAHEGEQEYRLHDRLLDVRRAFTVENNEKLQKFYVGELDKEKTTETDLTEYFTAFGTVVECTLVREAPEVEGQEGASKGYAFLLMSTIEEVDAILKHPTPHVLHEKELVVNRASPHTLHRAMITDRINKMNVTNFKGTDITEDDLREYFGKYGNIVRMELPFHRKTSKQLGFAVIEMDNHHDIEKLAIMHEHYIRDHRCVVTKFKRKDAEQKAKLKKKERKKRQETVRGRGRGFSRGGGWGGGGPPRGGRGFPQWNGGGGRGRGRGGWGRGGGGGGGEWGNFGEYGDGYYQGWESSCGPMRGFPGRGRGFGNHNRWGGGGYDAWDDGYAAWDDGYAGDGWRGGFGNGRGRGRGRRPGRGPGPRGQRRGRGGQRGRPY
ncbi:uncharacterized protein LOC119740062 [Patiria miniata]|uniref:RRM domain-containing protein n=1 Tax=Patiria miniata TaxID=46514 RepID=A0A914B6V5_PATMI|nr:uncharacterized protein LOC119740062 [Patiria miniata]